jgi:ribosome modulation factor
MVAVSDRVLLEELAAKVERLTRLVRRQGVVIDAMREAWLLPPVGVLLDERRAARAAAGTVALPLPEQPRTIEPKGTKRERAYREQVARARAQGRQAAAQGLTADDCPYRPGANGPRQAWLRALAEARVTSTTSNTQEPSE